MRRCTERSERNNRSRGGLSRVRVLESAAKAPNVVVVGLAGRSAPACPDAHHIRLRQHGFRKLEAGRWVSRVRRVRRAWSAARCPLVASLAPAACALVIAASGAQAAFPGANGVLAVQPRTGGGIVLVGADGRGARRVCTDRRSCGVPRRARWSPDGRSLVFAGPAIKIIYPDGSCLNCQFGAAPNPAFGPDGTVISFIHGGHMVVDGIDGIRQKSPPPGAASDAVWSAGGALAVVRDGAIWAGRPGRVRRIAAGSQPSWSPEARLIAAVQRGWVVIMRLRDRHVRRLARGSSPAFSPDGLWIAYVASDQRLTIVAAAGHVAARRVSTIRAVSVDWQPRPIKPSPACAAPPGSTILANSPDAIVTGDGLPLPPLGFSIAPPIAYMGCLHADGRERLLERFSDNSVDSADWVGPVVLAAPYAALVLDFNDEHYDTGQTGTVQVFDLRSGLLTKRGGETSTCFDLWERCDSSSGFDPVLLGSDGVSATHSQTLVPLGANAIGLQQLSCPPAGTSCIALDQDSRLFASSDPAGGAAAWMPSGVRLSSVACPSVSLCVGTGGKVYASTDPSGGAGTWMPVADVAADSVSCPAATLCVGSRYDGSVVTSTNPTGGTSAWSTAHIDDTGALDAVFCSALPECFITDSSHNVLTSTNPVGGARAWSRSTRTPAFTSGVCPTSDLCVAANGNQIFTTTDPANESWTQTRVADSLDSIACASSSLCLAVGGNGAVDVSTDPARGVWTHTTIDPGRLLTAVACSSSSLCVVGDHAGHIIASTNPSAAQPTWTTALIDGDPCTDTTPCSDEAIQTSDRTGMHTIDTTHLPGTGPFLTHLTLTADLLSWSHTGTPRSITLVH
jgi:hypothetical protein